MDNNNPYAPPAGATDSVESTVGANADRRRSVTLAYLSFGLLVVNIATVAGVCLSVYFRIHPNDVPLVKVLVFWILLGLPISSVGVLICNAIVDRRTSHSLLLIAMSVVCLALWAGLVLFVLIGMTQRQRQHDREFEMWERQRQYERESEKVDSLERQLHLKAH